MQSIPTGGATPEPKMEIKGGALDSPSSDNPVPNMFTPRTMMAVSGYNTAYNYDRWPNQPWMHYVDWQGLSMNMNVGPFGWDSDKGNSVSISSANINVTDPSIAFSHGIVSIDKNGWDAGLIASRDQNTVYTPLIEQTGIFTPNMGNPMFPHTMTFTNRVINYKIVYTNQSKTVFGTHNIKITEQQRYPNGVMHEIPRKDTTFGTFKVGATIGDFGGGLEY